MSEVPKNPLREKEEHRIAAEAKKREEKRAEAQLSILQEQATKADQQRQTEERHKQIERHNWTQQAIIGTAQLKAAKRLNCITIAAVIVGFVSAVAVIASVIAARSVSR
jgi:CHASE3 domain sensor protein